MPQSTVPDIRDPLARYLAGDLPLADLSRQLASAVWDIEGSQVRHTVTRLHELELGLAEFDKGDWDEDELWALFRPLLATPTIDYSQDTR